jgi:hypothetical protein
MCDGGESVERKILALIKTFIKLSHNISVRSIF